MSIAASQVSRFQRPTNQKRTYAQMNGELVPLNYEIKSISFQNKITIQSPQSMINYTTGDKQIIVRYMQYYDQLSDVTPSALQIQRILRIVSNSQQNNYDSEGKNTNVVGYLTYDIQKKVFQADCQPFEVDSRVPIVLQIQEYNWTNKNWVDLVFYDTGVSTTNRSFIYTDIEINYEFND